MVAHTRGCWRANKGCALCRFQLGCEVVCRPNLHPVTEAVWGISAKCVAHGGNDSCQLGPPFPTLPPQAVRYSITPLTSHSTNAHDQTLPAASGISDGLEMGNNARAALITRGTACNVLLGWGKRRCCSYAQPLQLSMPAGRPTTC